MITRRNLHEIFSTLSVYVKNYTHEYVFTRLICLFVQQMNDPKVFTGSNAITVIGINQVLI